MEYSDYIESFFTEKRKKIILAIVFVLALFLITFQFINTPMVWTDEGLFTEMSRNVAFHGVWGVQTAPGVYSLMNTTFVSVSYPVIFAVAVSLKLFGIGVFQARLPMILYMFLLVVFFYLFAKKRYGFYPAVLSVLLLLSFSPFYGDGRPVLGEVPGLVFFVLGAYWLLFWEESDFKNIKWALLTGFAFGLSAATKEIYLIGVPLAFIVALFFCFKRERQKVENKNTPLYFLLGFIPPVFVWAYIHLISSNTVMDFIPNYLYFSGNHGSNLSTIQTIVSNFMRFFTESTPILFSFLLIVTIVSFLFRFRKGTSEHFSVAECTIFAFVILNWAGYLKGTGWYRYFFPAHILLYLLFPAALLLFARHFKNQFLKKYLIVIPIVLVIFQFYYLIFLSDTSFVVSRTRIRSLL